MGFVRNVFKDALNGARCHANGVMDGKVPVNERAYPVGEREDATLGPHSVGAAFAVDHEAVSLPVNVLARESRELANAQSGIEKRPDNQALLVRLTGSGQAVGFVLKNDTYIS